MSYSAEKILQEIGLLQDSRDHKSMNSLEIIHVSKIVTGRIDGPGLVERYRHRNYDLHSIRQILKKMDEEELTLTETSRMYGISRNTLSSWKREFNGFAVRKSNK